MYFSFCRGYDITTRASTKTALQERKESFDIIFFINLFLFFLLKEIRCCALNCVLKLASLQNPNILIKFQRDVVRNIEPCLIDKKRLVRQKAVAARNKWYLLTTAE